MTEIRVVPGYPRLKATDEGKIIGPSGKTLSDFPDKRGYRRINIWEPGKEKDRRFQLGVHRLVCLAFHGFPPPGRNNAAHGDGNPGNNRPGNLRWATAVENELDKVEHGTKLQGVSHPQAKLTEADVLEIRRLRAGGVRGVDLAKQFDVTKTLITMITKRKIWSHI